MNQLKTMKFPLTHGCILITEDYKPNVIVATYILEGLGYSFDIAINGKEALKKISANREKYAAVLMDVQMPEMSGFEVTKLIREEENANNLPHIPIIAMTAHALRGDKELCLQAGMDDYISKPFDPHKLASKLEKATKSWEMVKDLYE